MSPAFPPANRPFAPPTLEIIADAATAAARDAVEHRQSMVLSRAQFAKLAIDRFDEVVSAHNRALAESYKP